MLPDFCRGFLQEHVSLTLVPVDAFKIGEPWRTFFVGRPVLRIKNTNATAKQRCHHGRWERWPNGRGGGGTEWQQQGREWRIRWGGCVGATGAATATSRGSCEPVLSQIDSATDPFENIKNYHKIGGGAFDNRSYKLAGTNTYVFNQDHGSFHCSRV